MILAKNKNDFREMTFTEKEFEQLQIHQSGEWEKIREFDDEHISVDDDFEMQVVKPNGEVKDMKLKGFSVAEIEKLEKENKELKFIIEQNDETIETLSVEVIKVTEEKQSLIDTDSLVLIEKLEIKNKSLTEDVLKLKAELKDLKKKGPQKTNKRGPKAKK